ncbi:MAG: hypothetical protein FJZ57_04730 [Chlamydiae bacterium]|nr:hypothetical protein [Chlamydiota bacterium]
MSGINRSEPSTQATQTTQKTDKEIPKSLNEEKAKICAAKKRVELAPSNKGYKIPFASSKEELVNISALNTAEKVETLRAPSKKRSLKELADVASVIAPSKFPKTSTSTTQERKRSINFPCPEELTAKKLKNQLT